MGEPVLSGPDGRAVDPQEALRQFHQSMAAPEPDEPAAPSPPRQAPDPGLKLDGTPKKGPGGRPPKNAARVVKDPAPAAPPASAGAGARDYTEDLNDTVRTAFVLALPWAPADAGAIAAYGLDVAAGANQLAQVNPQARRMVQFVTANSAILAFAGAVLPLAAQVAANHGVKLGPLGGMTTTREEMIGFARETAELMAENAAAQRKAAMAAAQGVMAGAGHSPSP